LRIDHANKGSAMAFARLNGVVLHYDSGGSADLPPLVFANSLGTDFRIWDAVAERLSNRYRVVRYDKRGHGLSEAPPPPYALTDHVADLTALIDHLGVEKTAMVGLSVGGLIAQGLAALHPERIAALVLSNTAHKIGTEASWNERIATVEAGGVAAVADIVMQRWFTPAYRRPDNADFAGYLAMFVRTPVDGYVGTCASVRDADLTESTRALKLPVLCIAGDQDGTTPPEVVRSMAELIRNSEFRIIGDAGHIPCIEQPEAVAGLIGTFLRNARYG
jgi:3-oxoadipate enol-lactonase